MEKQNVTSNTDTSVVANKKKPKSDNYVNEEIPFKQVYVIGNNGEKIGVLAKKIAIEQAKSQGLDLVVISTEAAMPVAKMLDYGKFKYDRKKSRQKAKANQTKTQNHEIRLTPMIGDHDLITKSKKAREFVLNGDRVKVSLKFRGREMSRQDLGYDKLKQFYDLLEDVAKIEKEAMLTGGRYLDMYLTKKEKDAPKKVAVTKEAQDAKDEN